MVGCSAAKGAAPYKKFIRIAVFCLQWIYLGIGVCNCIVHKVHIFYSSMEMSRVHFIFGLYWAGQIVYSRAAPLPRIKVIYTNRLCLYACTAREEISLCFFSPPWNSLSNTVAERRAKGLSMDALTPNSPQWLFVTLSSSSSSHWNLSSSCVQIYKYGSGKEDLFWLTRQMIRNKLVLRFV